MKPLVSVIIPTHKGAEKETQRCVDSIDNSTFKDFEIIVINAGKERSEQRNIGIQKARGRYLLVLDSDQYIHPKLLEDCVNRIKFFGGIYIPEVITTPGWFGHFRNWERQFYTGTAVDCVRFVRAYRCPLFDKSMSGPEDSDWDRCIEGLKTTSKECLYHDDGVDIKKYFAKKIYYAKSMRHFAEKWPDDKVLQFKYRCWTIFVEDGKWKKLLQKPLFTVALALMLLIRGVIYLCAKKS